MKTGRNVATAAHPDNVLLDELRKPEYDGLSEGEAYEYLFAERPAEIAYYGRLTVLTVARVLGPEKTEALVTAVTAAYPATVQYLLSAGLDPANESVTAFLANVLSAEDRASLVNAVAVWNPARPPRSVLRFSGVAGMPNLVSPEDFAPAFKQR